MALHTDGTYVEEPTDWLLMMKSAEVNAAGGRSRLLHLDDWEDLSRFRTHPLAEHPFLYRSPPSKNVPSRLRRPTFYDLDGRPCIAFIDQFANPETIEQAEFLFDLSQSLEQSAAVKNVSLNVGELVMLNNHFWVHGREAFQKQSQLSRGLIRLRGRWFGS
jgi:protein CsiD